MEQNCYYHNEKVFSNIANRNIPSLVIKIDISQTFESPSKNSETSQKVNTIAADTVSKEAKNSMHDENLENILKEIKRQIMESSPELTQWFKEIPVEALPIVSGKKKIVIDVEDLKNFLKNKEIQTSKSQYSAKKCLKKSSVPSESSIVEENEILIGDLTNVLKEIKSQVSMNEMPDTMPLNTEFLQEIPHENESAHLKERGISLGYPSNVERITNRENQKHELFPRDTEYFPEIPDVSNLITVCDTETQNSSVNQMPELRLQKTKLLEEILDEGNKATIKNIKCNISELLNESTEQLQSVFVDFQTIPLYDAQIHQGSPQHIENSVENAVAPEITFSKATEIASEKFANIDIKSKFQSINEMTYLSSQSTASFDDNHVDVLTRKRKRDIGFEEAEYPVKKIVQKLSQPKHIKTALLKEVSSKSMSLRKKRKQTSSADFKNTVKKIKKQCRPEMQVSLLAVETMNDMILHLHDIFDEELHNMKTIRKIKTLTENQLEIAVKFCLPKMLSSRAMKYGRMAVEEACRKTNQIFPTSET